MTHQRNSEKIIKGQRNLLLIAIALSWSFLCNVTVAFSTPAFQPLPCTPSYKLRAGRALVELYAKRKQIIKRWGSEGSGSGFGKKPGDNNEDEDEKTDGTSRPSQPKEQIQADTKNTEPTPSPATKPLPVFTAAEYARLNTLATKQRHEQEESKRYVTEYLKQKLLATPKQLVQISESPLLFVIDEFIDPEACRKVDNQANGCFHLLFPESVADQLFQGQESELDGLLFNAASSQEHDASASDHAHYPDGLHMDTNNQCLFRHVTCLLYLNDVPEENGGATIFPVARAKSGDPALKAAEKVLEHSISHTRSREIVALDLQEEATLLESRIQTNCVLDPETNTAIRIQPKAGRLLIFFSRDERGREDPRTWHAGERLRAGSDGRPVEKRILTLFKEVDYEDKLPLEEACTLETFLSPQISSQRKWLQAKAKL